MSKSIAIYPNENYLESIAKWDSYAFLASQFGFGDIFTTVHLPEVDILVQLNALLEIGRIAKKYAMSLTCDIGGKYIDAILNDNTLLQMVKESEISYIRLDCNYDFDQVERLYQSLKVKGFVINASTYNQKELEKHMAFFSKLDDCKLKACHNFYPREESGLDKEFALVQDEMYRKYINDICYCIGSLEHPRGPIYKGLPTIEQHRYLDEYSVAKELKEIYHADSILLADEYFSKEELQRIAEAFQKEEKKYFEIEVEVFNDEYDDIIFKEHHFRYDSNSIFLRSESSRRMAEFAKEIKQENTVDRFAGAITIDNVLYKRYSGELQVVLQDCKADERVNVVGKVSLDDLETLKLHRNGYQYIFVRKRAKR